MISPHIFDSINIQLPKKEIYSRLGYQRGKTKILPQQEKEVEGYIEKASKLIKLKGSAKRVPIVKKDSAGVIFSSGVDFRSQILSTLLEGSREALFVGATAGSGIVKLICENKNDNLTEKIVFDAVASETVNAALDWIEEYFVSQLKRENKKLTKRRISCGYGDFLLQYQKEIFKGLNLKKLGVKISENFILTPEKSVTGVYGILDM